MAFNFLGTYSRNEIDTLLEFARSQSVDVEDRISYLRAQVERTGWVTFQRDEEGAIQSYQVTPDSSTLAKCIRAYEFWGGDMKELPILSRGEWISLSKAEPSLDSQVPMVGGLLQGASEDYYPNDLHKNDAVEAVTTAKVKDWMLPAIKAKRENWEYKIKKTIDLSDQLLNEIILLAQRASGADTLDDLQTRIEYFISSDQFTGAGKKLANRG